ncbi:CIA30 family protein [Flaviramulus sp. BrNp1-15]|uniref:CIA30 family protein n=1 Tax=Flaviramulus sp. BrNp1-15 TaxID=2916754 RepID=UPI001EE7BB77|nr:CIA30 family protein [Flaviramulus sp. BrNp1-15]ULC58917.1 CIA30 family protein [Flaviramulus sp. BrNp1-15]
MKTIVLFISLTILQTSMTIFNFKTQSDITNWNIVDDVVMGGRSNGTFSINKEGFGIFEGTVSLENNGGFSMVQYKFNTKNVNSFSKVYIKLKGDGKTYQFRVKSKNSDKHSYVFSFETNNNWQTIEIPFNKLYPAFRGRTLDIENYSGEQMEMIAFLIGNKKAESFKLEIESIKLE